MATTLWVVSSTAADRTETMSHSPRRGLRANALRALHEPVEEARGLEGGDEAHEQKGEDGHAHAALEAVQEQAASRVAGAIDEEELLGPEEAEAQAQHHRGQDPEEERFHEVAPAQEEEHHEEGRQGHEEGPGRAHGRTRRDGAHGAPAAAQEEVDHERRGRRGQRVLEPSAHDPRHVGALGHGRGDRGVGDGRQAVAEGRAGEDGAHQERGVRPEGRPRGIEQRPAEQEGAQAGAGGRC